MVDLQAYTTFDEVYVLVHKVKQQKKARQPPEPENPKPFTRNQTFNRGSADPISKTQICPLPFHKETQLHKRSKPLNIDLILILWAIEDASNAKDLGI